MNRREAEIFEAIFIRREIFERIDPKLDALDILQSYEDLALPDAISRVTRTIIRNVEHKDRGSKGAGTVN